MTMTHPGSRARRAPAPLSPLSRTLLRLVWSERQISRAELARRTGLSRSTITELVPALLATTLVVEAGVGPSSGGRRPILLQFRDDAFAILGVDLGATHVSVAVMDLRGSVLAWQHRDFAVQEDPEGARALVTRLCRSTLTAARVERDRLIGIGVALPSPIDPRHPERLHRLTLPKWNQEHRLRRLEEQFGVPVLFDNDANVGALAEHYWGAARGVSDFTFIKMGTGVGAGHVFNGSIYRGAAGVAGEIGHLSIDLHGRPCNCGNRGCLQTYVSAPSLVARAAELLPEYPASTLHQCPLTIQALESAALDDDPLALRVVGEAGEYLGIATTSLVNLLNPSAVIIGGGVSRLGERLLAPMRTTVERRTFASTASPVTLRVSDLGERDVAMGAATLVFDALLQDPVALLAARGALGAEAELTPS